MLSNLLTHTFFGKLSIVECMSGRVHSHRKMLAPNAFDNTCTLAIYDRAGTNEKNYWLVDENLKKRRKKYSFSLTVEKENFSEKKLCISCEIANSIEYIWFYGMKMKKLYWISQIFYFNKQENRHLTNRNVLTSAILQMTFARCCLRTCWPLSDV